jgi:hypothetical protein
MHPSLPDDSSDADADADADSLRKDSTDSDLKSLRLKDTAGSPDPRPRPLSTPICFHEPTAVEQTLATSNKSLLPFAGGWAT